MKKNCVIYHAPDLELSTYIPYFEREGIFLKEINSSTIKNLETHETLKIILIDDEYLSSVNDEIAEKLFSPNESNTIILINEGHKRKKCNYLEEDRIFLYLNKPISKDALLKAVKSSFLYLRSKSEYESLRSEIYLRTTEFDALNKIGMPLSSERNFNRLLSIILSKSREITNCDAGSLYLLEETKEGEKKLVFKLTQNDSIANLPFCEYTLAVDKTSIAGHVALTGKFVNIKDAYSLSKGLDYSFNRDFDRRFNYRTKSILAIPIIRYNKTIGVLELINRKKTLNVKVTSDEIVDAEVISFDEKSIGVINSVANHAALSIGDIIWSQTIRKISELSDLNKIGMALSTEQDYDKLLALILSKSREITNCDAGSLYLLEDTKEGERRLVFKLVQNNSLTNLSFHEYSLPVSGTSIAGYVALTGEFINLEDAYNIPEVADYSFNKDFDKRFNYRTKSMLAIPMIGHNNKIIGVLELINRKKSLNVKLASDQIVDAEVVPFDEKSIEIINSVTSQAAMSIENNIWTKTIQKIFELSDLNKIGIALSSEQDYDKLLALILSKSREITSCDAGSLYVLEETKEGEKELVFKLTQNDSLANLPFHEYTLAVDKTSIAGYVALTGKVVNLADVYNVPEEADYSYNKEFDKKFNYRSKSMLVIPMKDHKGKTIGVVQLLNRKSSRNIKLVNEDIVKIEVITFDERSIEMVNSLASQASVAIENNLLYQNIRKLFEGFVKASVHAIEQRDPTTFGHSERVAAMTVRLAELVDKTTKGKFRDVYFTKDQMKEIRYAGLLHDFGKVGVRENVLVKAKKLYPENLELIKNRFAFIKMSIECGYLKKNWI